MAKQNKIEREQRNEEQNKTKGAPKIANRSLCNIRLYLLEVFDNMSIEHTVNNNHTASSCEVAERETRTEMSLTTTEKKEDLMDSQSAILTQHEKDSVSNHPQPKTIIPYEYDESCSVSCSSSYSTKLPFFCPADRRPLKKRLSLKKNGSPQILPTVTEEVDDDDDVESDENDNCNNAGVDHCKVAKNDNKKEVEDEMTIQPVCPLTTLQRRYASVFPINDLHRNHLEEQALQKSMIVFKSPGRKPSIKNGAVVNTKEGGSSYYPKNSIILYTVAVNTSPRTTKSNHRKADHILTPHSSPAKKLKKTIDLKQQAKTRRYKATEDRTCDRETTEKQSKTKKNETVSPNTNKDKMTHSKSQRHLLVDDTISPPEISSFSSFVKKKEKKVVTISPSTPAARRPSQRDSGRNAALSLAEGTATSSRKSYEKILANEEDIISNGGGSQRSLLHTTKSLHESRPLNRSSTPSSRGRRETFQMEMKTIQKKPQSFNAVENHRHQTPKQFHWNGTDTTKYKSWPNGKYRKQQQQSICLPPCQQSQQEQHLMMARMKGNFSPARNIAANTIPSSSSGSTKYRTNNNRKVAATRSCDEMDTSVSFNGDIVLPPLQPLQSNRVRRTDPKKQPPASLVPKTEHSLGMSFSGRQHPLSNPHRNLNLSSHHAGNSDNNVATGRETWNPNQDMWNQQSSGPSAASYSWDQQYFDSYAAATMYAARRGHLTMPYCSIQQPGPLQQQAPPGFHLGPDTMQYHQQHQQKIPSAASPQGYDQRQHYGWETPFQSGSAPYSQVLEVDPMGKSIQGSTSKLPSSHINKKGWFQPPMFLSTETPTASVGAHQHVHQEQQIISNGMGPVAAERDKRFQHGTTKNQRVPSVIGGIRFSPISLSSDDLMRQPRRVSDITSSTLESNFTHSP